MVITKEQQDKIDERVEWCRRHAIAASIELSEDFDKFNTPGEREITLNGMYLNKRVFIDSHQGMYRLYVCYGLDQPPKRGKLDYISLFQPCEVVMSNGLHTAPLGEFLPVERTRHTHDGLTCDTVMFVPYRP